MTVNFEEAGNYPPYGEFVPAREVRIPDYPHPHEVRVWLPPSYHHTDKVFPTLWVSDNALEVAWPAVNGSQFGYAPELILVSVGSPRDTTLAEMQSRRIYDFSPEHSYLNPGIQHIYPPASVGGAPRFRDFLIDDLRSQLASEYRMDPRDHGYAGFSGGANFGLFILLTRPEGFTKYVLGSPGWATDYLRLEAEYAAGHSDLNARVFFSLGESEGTDPWMATWGRIWYSVATVSEALVARGYPSLELTLKVVPGHHLPAWPVVYIEGVQALWRDYFEPPTLAEVEAITSSTEQQVRAASET